MTEETMTRSKTLQVIRGDITLLEVDAFVFYAQPSLQLGTGIGNAIAVRGGPTIQQELDALGPREVCDVVATSAGKLAASYILHAVGPRFQEEDLEEKLRRTIRKVLALAEEKGIERLALPPMGRGFYGVPLDQCARVTSEELQAFLADGGGVREITICVTDTIEVATFEKHLGHGEGGK